MLRKIADPCLLTVLDASSVCVGAAAAAAVSFSAPSSPLSFKGLGSDLAASSLTAGEVASSGAAPCSAAPLLSVKGVGSSMEPPAGSCLVSSGLSIFAMLALAAVVPSATLVAPSLPSWAATVSVVVPAEGLVEGKVERAAASQSVGPGSPTSMASALSPAIDGAASEGAASRSASHKE